jgi:hypothetical protein
MALVYDDTSVKPPYRGGPIADKNPLPPYLRHYGNLLYLKFIQARGTKEERYQATKEIRICERKLAFWSRHPKWEAAQAASAVFELKASWQVK